MKSLITVFCAICIAGSAAGQNVPLSSTEGYYLRISTYPDDLTNWWMQNGLEVQGVTHDDDNWYFTLTAKSGNNGFLRRIPRSVPLASNPQPSHPGIRLRSMTDVPELTNAVSGGYWHWGDPDHYRYNGIDYILVPIPGPIIACFRADNLQFINYAHLNGSVQDYAGWCAVGRDGALYSSGNHAWGIVRYSVDWQMLTTSSNGNNHNAMTYTGYYAFLSEGGAPIQLWHMQGGEFSPSGELLYVVCGSASCLGQPPNQNPMPSDGIHVFETVNWRRVQRSGNGAPYFDYSFNNGCTCLSTGSQTPEGLTIWDLDDGSAPGVSGQLHVLKDHYNVGFCDDAVSMQHFGNKVHVSTTGVTPPYGGFPYPGTASRPFRTLNLAYGYYPLWDGAELVLRTGTYNDTGTYTKRVKITSAGGAAVVGQ